MRRAGRETFFGVRVFCISFFFLLVMFLCRPVFSADIRLIEATELNSALSKWIVIDARPRTEWAAGHIPGARSFQPKAAG